MQTSDRKTSEETANFCLRMVAGVGVDTFILISDIDIAHSVQTRKLGFSGILQLWVTLCAWLWLYLPFKLRPNFIGFRPVYAGALLSIPSPSSLVSIIIFELNNAGVVCIIVESWLKVTTPNGTSNLQCNWEFLGVVFGWGRKLTTGCSYGGDVWTIMLCVAE